MSDKADQISSLICSKSIFQEMKGLKIIQVIAMMTNALIAIKTISASINTKNCKTSVQLCMILLFIQN